MMIGHDHHRRDRDDHRDHQQQQRAQSKLPKRLAIARELSFLMGIECDPDR
jgi:hypothetical protein